MPSSCERALLMGITGCLSFSASAPFSLLFPSTPALLCSDRQHLLALREECKVRISWYCSCVAVRVQEEWLVHGSGHAENARGCRNKTRPFILGVLSRTIYKASQHYLLLRFLPRIRILILKAECTCVWACMKMKNTNLEAFVQISAAP